MASVITELVWKVDMLFVLLLFCIGLYCLFSKPNLIKLIIGVEVLAKAVTLCFVLTGYIQNNTAIAQAIVVTIILIEVIIAAVALSLVVNVYRHNASLDVRRLRRLHW
jgi:multisubunit Na+/H+ antiporter MnhC subunit